MTNLLRIRSKSSVWMAATLSVFFIFCPAATSPARAHPDGAFGLRIKLNDGPVVPLFDKTPVYGLSLAGLERPFLKFTPRSFKRDTRIDSTGTMVIIKETIFGNELLLPYHVELNDYVRMNLQHAMATQWLEMAVKHLKEKETGTKRKSGGVDIDIPVKIKHKAFQRIFGGSTVGLTVTGDINIDGGFRHEKRSEVKTALTRGSDYNFKMQQKQRFQVKGRVGEKVTVSVDQDSERPFDFENTIRLKYEGYEDEIVQSIEAGNISLSLPATRFVTFSGKNSGLFGIKSNMIMGNLKVIAIASQEKGENNKITISGGATEGKQTIYDYQYIKGVYFFLDDSARAWYTRLAEDGTHLYDPSRVITDIEVYKSAPGYETKQGAIRGWAVLDPTQLDTSQTSQENYVGYWLRLEKNEYFVATDSRYIRLNNAVTEDEYLAVAYRDTSGQRFGDIPFDPQKGTIILKLIKPRSPRPGDKTWNLMWRHVYYLGARNIEEEGFELKIFYRPPSGDLEETQTRDGVSKSYLEIFKLDRKDQYGNLKPDNIIDQDNNILRLGPGELEFPDLRPFDPKTPSELAPDKRVPSIYDTTSNSYIRSQSKFVIEVKSKNRSANYSLGFNVIEGSEDVYLNGAKLTRGTDYIIDYYTGSLTILNEQATNPSANVEISYQRNQLFQLEKKTLVGMRAEYQLWENSFIGGTMLYLNERTLDQKIRVGKGPMRNMIWDLNTALRFKPDFLTKAIDAFPLIETKAPSSLSIEGEIAQVLPNPNTMNSEATDDPSGVAYIDDFEGAKKETPLGVMRPAWTLASAPAEYYPDVSKMRRIYWYNPYLQVPIQDIWPNREYNPSFGQRGVHVLNIVVLPNDTLLTPESYWGGIMKPLSAGYADQSESKFLEVWVKGDSGRLHIDLGQISEDVIPNGKLNTEDKKVNGVRNELLDDDEDVGLDGMPGRDPSDFWDINKNGVRDPGEPISWDDWYYNPNEGADERINGTEGNRNDQGGLRPDTEDINGNGDVDLINNYFEYSFSLDKSSPDSAMYIKGGNPEKGWYLYRIPLSDTSKVVGTPDISRIEFVRIWVDGFSASGGFLSIAEINLVGNDWKEMGIALSDTSTRDANDDTTVTATVINTHDNPDYVPPPGVVGVRDRITGVRAKEQSLVIRIKNLKPGADGTLQKTFFQAQNYIYYDKMKMYIHGGNADGENFSTTTTQVEFFLQFGADKNNYYEFREPVYKGWERNEMEIDLNELASLKLLPDTARVKYFDDGKVWRVVGKPSLTNIRQLTAGVKNLDETKDFSGEIWLNELRLSYVKKDKGMAMRARVDLKLADLASFNAEINRQDADFHNLSTRFGTGNNRLSGTFNGSFSLHKLLPKSWGLSLPVSFNYTQSQATPKYLPGSDILVTSATPDTILKKIQNINSQRGFGVSFRKTTRSSNFFIRNTLDRLSLSFNQTKGRLSNSTTEFSDKKNHSGNIGYKLTFPSKKFIKPFGWLGNAPIIKKLSGLKFYYLPTNLDLKLSGTESQTESLTRTGVRTTNYTFYLSRSISTGFKPFDSMSLTYNRVQKSDMRKNRDDMSRIFSGDFGDEIALNQSFSAKYNPKFFSWLSNNLSYSTDYKWNYNQQMRETGRSASNNTTISGSLSFDPNRLIKSIYKPTATSKARRFRRPPRKEAPKKPEGETPSSDKSKTTKKKDKKKKQDQQQKKSFSFIFGGLDKITQKLKTISLNYTQRNSVSNYGLKPGRPNLAYQFGQSRDPGIETVESIGTNRGAYNHTESYAVQTGVKVTSNCDISLKYNYNKSRKETTTITGDFSESWFKSGDINMRFPEWSIRWSGLERLSLFKDLVQRISLDHSFNGKKSISWNTEEDNIIGESFQAGFRPLVGITIAWKNGISTNIRYNSSETLNMTVSGTQGGRKMLQSDLSITASYSKSTGFRIPIPIWPFKNREFKNNVDISITFNSSKSVTLQNRMGGNFEEMDKLEKWSFMPQLTYSFSNRVRGAARFEIGKNKSKRIGETSIQEFGINVNIAIRGG